MANTAIQLKKSGQTGNVPSSLSHGEIALNYADGKLYYKNSSNVITYINNQDTFSTVNVGGNLILASSPTSTLSFEAGNNISLQTDVLTNKIIIATTGSATDSTARDNANAASSYANSSFAVANSGSLYANGAFTTANSAGSYANAAFIKANSAYASQNTTGSYANAAFLKANSALANSNNAIFDGNLNVTGKLTITESAGDEGGQLQLATAQTNSTLSGPIAIDIYQNKIRFFETTGSNRGAYIDLSTASGGAGTNLLAPPGGSVTSVGGATGAVSNTQLITGIQAVSSSYGITFDYVATANNGQGTNFKVGDDAWIGDYNAADSIKIKGQQNAANGYISFGSNNSSLGVAGSGQLTYGGNIVWHAGNDGTGSGLDADLLDGLNSTDLARVSAESYANAAFIQANAAFLVANTPNHVANSAALYANSAFAKANAAFNYANTLTTSSIANGTSNVAISSANGNITAAVAGNTVVTISANGISTSSSGGSGDILGANNIYSNNFIATTSANIAGINVVPYIQSVFTQANAAFLAANTPSATANSAATYANGAFTQANAAFTVANTDVTNVSVTAGQYGNTTTVPVITIAANGRITSVSNATISGGGGSGSYISNGTSNLYFAGANSSIVANVAGNTIVTITANGIVTSGVSGDITGANNITANSFITTGSGGNISGANNVFANTVNLTTSVIVSGLNVVPYIQSAFGTANAAFIAANTPSATANSAATYANGAFTAANSAGSYANAAFTVANTDVTNVSVTAGQYGNTTTVPVITIAANGRITSVSNATISGGGGSGSYIANGTSNVYFSGANILANVSGNTIVTITANGIVTSGVSGDISGANNITANSFITTGSGGNISGANNIYANNVIAANGITIAGVNALTYIQSAFGTANGAFTAANSAGSYANSAFTVANTDVTNVSVTAGQYGNTTTVPVLTIAANGRITAITNATISGGGSGSYIANGTSNVYFSGANILANVSGNTIVTITANGIITSSSTGSGDISGANNIYANNFIAVTSVSISGLNVSPYIQSSFTHANAAFAKANTGVANTANTANTANSASIANTSVYAKVTGVTTGVYYPIITDTTVTGQDTLHYSNNDFQMFAANNTFRATGNVWAGQWITVGTATATPVVNTTGHWIGQTISGTVDNYVRPVANSGALYANGAFAQANAAFIVANTPTHVANSAALYANGAFTQANAAFNYANTAITTSGGTITGSLNVSANVVIAGNLIVLGSEIVVNATTLEIDDSLIYLGGNNYTSDVVDIGIIANYNDGGNAHTGIFRDAVLKEWIFFKGYTPEVQSNNLINIADPSFAYANVWASYFKGNLIANTVTVSGNTTISGVTNLGPVANVRITGGTNGYVLSTDGAGNLSWVVQSGGGGGSGTDQTARDTANAAFIQANAAYAQANTGGGGGGSGSSIIAVDTFTANGTGNTYTLSYSTSTNNVIVNIDGVLQLKSAYAVSGSTLTLTGTPVVNAKVEVTTLTGTNLSYYNRTYTGDNTTVSFASTSGVSNVSLIVTENGVIQEPGVDYYISGANVVFTTAPSTGVKIGVRELASTAVVNADITPAFNQANAAFTKANTAVTTGKSIAMAIVFGG
jgi:hypothetical protein